MLRSLVQQSRKLRKNQTPHEKKLWQFLKNRNIERAKFRRQYTIDRYIVDFCCPDKKLIIELDGSGHGEPEQEIIDKNRDAELKRRGYRIIRIWNIELDQNFEGVMDSIFSTVSSPSPLPLTPTLSPKGRGRHGAFIGIGANLGNPLAQCQQALELIRQIPQTSLTACSSFYRSDPLVPNGQNPEGIPQYVNAVCRLQTRLSPQDLLKNLQEIEKTMGRIKRTKWASREIDLDLLFYDDRVIRKGNITIPHPELHKRGFVIRPLSEIAPDWVHPLLGKSVANLEKNLEDKCKFSLIQLM